MIILALGTNIGNKEQNLKTALEQLELHGIIVKQASKIYETEPLGPQNQDDYLNMAIDVETKLEPLELLQTLKKIEKNMGREKTIHWGPRIIDIDIIFYNDVVIESKELTIPHKEMHKRNFVLEPVIEITKDTIHPVLKKSIKTLQNELKTSDQR